MTPEQRTARARHAAHAMHAKHDSRKTTAAARRVFLAGFETQVDPDGVLPAPERARRAEHARKAHFMGMRAKRGKR